MTVSRGWIQAAATRLGVSESTVRRWIRTGRLNPDCYQIYAQVLPYLDRELAPEDVQQVERHLSACPGCEEHFRFDGDVLRFVKQRVPRAQMPDTMQERLLERFRGAPAPPESSTAPTLPQGDS